MNLRRINRPWFVRFHDGEEWLNQPGDLLEVLAIDGFHDECFVCFRGRMRRGWHSRESVYWYSDRILNGDEREALEAIQREADAAATAAHLQKTGQAVEVPEAKKGIRQA